MANEKLRTKDLLMFVPNLIGLCGRLMADRRVPFAEKALVAAAVVYAVLPLDMIPDLIPLVGQVDDAALIGLALLRLINRSNETVVREHWRGVGDVVRLAGAVAKLAPRFLPQRVSRVLTS